MELPPVLQPLLLPSKSFNVSVAEPIQPGDHARSGAEISICHASNAYGINEENTRPYNAGKGADKAIQYKTTELNVIEPGEKHDVQCTVQPALFCQHDSLN